MAGRKKRRADKQGPAAGPWKAQAVPRYNRARKRLSKAVLTELNRIQAAILQNPLVGEKKGALKDVLVEKFQAENHQFLVAYSIDEKKREVIFLDLQRYLKTRREALGHAGGIGKPRVRTASQCVVVFPPIYHVG